MEEIRRRQLIEATIASIHYDGYANTTLARIARRAGLSAGIVAHYFDDRAGLLEATMRHLAEDLRLQVIAALHRTESPEARVLAIVDANFSDEQYVPELVSAWLAFWGLVRQSPRLARIQHVYQRRLHSNLLHALRQILPDDRAERLARGLGALIDGLWLNSALAERPIPQQEARAILRAYLAGELGPAAVAEVPVAEVPVAEVPVAEVPAAEAPAADHRRRTSR